MSRSNYDYWFERERDNLANHRLSEVEADRELQRIYFRMLDDTQAQIDAFWGRFANREDITINEAMQRVSQFDVDAYSRKVARVIQSHKVRGGLPAQAQEALRLYNATMRVNRLEMLRSTIGVELINNFSHAEQFMTQQLTTRTMGELRRQAGILGNTIVANQQSARAIVGASFRNATFSQRLWGHQQRLSNELGSLLSRGLIQGRGSRELSRELRRLFMGSDGALFNAQRLMQTELARVQTEAQMLSFERNGFRQYVYLAIEDDDVCEICEGIDGKVFNVSDKQVGANAPPIHPFCRCSVAAHRDENEYREWLAGQEDSAENQENSFTNQEESDIIYKKLTEQEFDEMRHSISREEMDIVKGKGHFEGYINSANASARINNPLRNGEALDPEMQKIADTLSGIISKNTVDENIEVFRYVKPDALESILGVRFPEPSLLQSQDDFFREHNAVFDTIERGRIYTEKGFLSTSGVEGQNVMTDKSVRMNIKVPSGVNGYITRNNHESEIIFDTNTRLKILDAYPANDSGRTREVVIDAIIER